MIEIAKDELDQNYKHFMTIGDLKKFIENSGLSDDARVLVQRVEDYYFNIGKWAVYLKEGEHYNNVLRLNKQMLDEVEHRKNGGEPTIDAENPMDYYTENLEPYKEQFIPAWCVTKFQDDNNLFIYLHY